MEIGTNTFILKIEAIIAGMDDQFVQFQITGSYETLSWPRKLIENKLTVGDKVIVEIKNSPLTSIQKVIEKAGQENKGPTEQRKLLESLIN